ncbi:RGS domain-containing protein [Syncephalis plumigaleata]|nr:RGS domain-containing protein [Syncephalis plumigaleata]
MSTVASLDEHSNEAANPGGIQRVRRSTLASLISSSIGSTLFEHQPDSFNEFSPCIVLGSWYWRHRERQSFGAVSLLLTALILVVLVFTSIIYVIAYETNSLLATKEISICLTRWPFWPACIACTLCQLVLMPMIYRKIPKTQNGFGMRVELLLLTLGGATVYLFILITLIAIPQRMRYIRTLCLICPIVFYLLYVHVCTVLYPVIKARRTKRQQERSHDALSWAAFEALLANPIRFKRFKQFSKRDYSSENAIFYEHCRRLRNNALSLERTLLDRELRHIWYTFIETSAPLQIHLDANTTTRIRQHIFNGGQLCTDVRILDTALLEVCELMYQHTYPRFVAWETANQHCSPSDEPV